MDTLFASYPLNPRGLERAHSIARAFDILLGSIVEACPDAVGTREFALCKTHLEIGGFYAIKAMAKLPENHT